MAFAFGLAAEIERQLISERTKSSLANIKANGKKLGRPFNAKTKKLKLAKTKNRYRSCWRKEYQNQKLQNYSALSERLYTDIYSDCHHKPKSHLNNPKTNNLPFRLQLPIKMKYGCYGAICGKTIYITVLLKYKI